MKLADCVSGFWDQMCILPLSWLSLSLGKRLWIVALSYCLGEVGLWFLFPLTHNGATMYLPIVSACWLFRYRGMFISLVLNGIVFQVTYMFLLRGLLPDQAFVGGAIIGFGTSLGLGMVVCWLRMAVDMVYAARQKTLAAEQERFQAVEVERQMKLAYERQCKINELKDQFLLNVNHELRTPLTVLGGFLELLEEHHTYLEEAERAHWLKKAIVSHKVLVDLVNRVLDAATVIGEIPLAQCQAVDVDEVLKEVLAYMAPEDVQAYMISLQVPEKVMVWADPQFLRQVLRNLFSNIFKYVPTQTEVRVEVVQAESSSQVCLIVQDAGPGIPNDELLLLFEKFVRLKRDMAGSTRGTGLGLYISKRLVEGMGGRIWAESSGRTGEGSRFYVALPSSAPVYKQ
jgi:signal transduction histidine kinase